MLLLAVLIGLFTLIQLNHIRAAIGNITQVHSRLLDLNKELATTLLSQVRYEKKYVLVPDLTIYDGFITAGKEFNRLLATSINLADDNQLHSSLTLIADLHRQYHAMFEQDVSEARTEKHLKNTGLAIEREQAVNSIMTSLAELREQHEHQIQARAAELDLAGSRAATVTILTTSTALVLGLLLSLLITRSITRPLSLLQRKTEEISQGNFNPEFTLKAPPEIEHLAESLNNMSMRLQQVDQIKTDFYSLMSHELRTPLTSIREGTNLFLEGACGDVTEKQRELLVIISEESTRLIDMVNSLLDLSRLESGLLEFDFIESDLKPLINQVVREVTPLASAKKIEIRTECPVLQPIRIDLERILQLLRNLIGNALKFTPDEGQIIITVKQSQKATTITVKDNGPGIALDKQEQIFSKFSQASEHGGQNWKGTGLGLAIVKHIVTAHGGKVWVESSPDKGSTFIVSLPA